MSSASTGALPAVMGTAGSHDAMRRVLASRKPCKILDAPAGQGALALFLSELGYDVHCADIDAQHFMLGGKLPFEAVNLNRKLPYADATFDAVVTANGLQRLFNPGGAIREFARILRPGGSLYVNVNNYASIEKRLRFLVCGSIDSAINEGLVHQNIDEPEANVRMCLLYPQLANLLTAAGFEVLEVQRSAVRPVQRLLAPIAWAVKPLSFLVPPARRRRDHIGVTSSGAIFPGGQYFFVEAVKQS